MDRDYSSFSSAAKSRFRMMAHELEYEQITGIVYTKERDGWYETFNLQASSYGNPFFYINFGVILPKELPASRESLRDSGWHLGDRLMHKDGGAFPCATKAEIRDSAEYALDEYKRVVVPMFSNLTLEKILAKVQG